MYAITDPGAVSGFTSEGLHLNGDGDVVGVLRPVVGETTKAFVWKSTLTVLPDLGHAAEARAINDSGDIAGTAESAPGRLAAVVWSPSSVLTKLAEPVGAVTSFTHGIDDAGRVVGGFIQAGPREVPLLWSNLHAPLAPPVVAPLPSSALWSEALGVDGGAPVRVCGTSSDGTRDRAFVWHTGTGAIDMLAGETAVVFSGGDLVGSAQGKPALWPGGAGAPTILPGLTGLASGLADGLTSSDEIVGTVSIPNIPSTARPFLRRRFRRDEIDPASSPLFPAPLQLPGPETIDLNALVPPGSGWTLLTATAINRRGQITGTGVLGGQPRAYRLSPPAFESLGLRILEKSEVLIIFGGVAAGGGGFGITPSGHIVPIPPPRPDAVTSARVAVLARKSLRELAAHAKKSGQQAAFRKVLEAMIKEATAILKS